MPQLSQKAGNTWKPHIVRACLDTNLLLKETLYTRHFVIYFLFIICICFIYMEIYKHVSFFSALNFILTQPNSHIQFLWLTSSLFQLCGMDNENIQLYGITAYSQVQMYRQEQGIIEKIKKNALVNNNDRH